jgi:hypothetical protein
MQEKKRPFSENAPQSDYDQIAAACERVKERKKQTMGLKEAHLVPFLSQSEDLTPKSNTPSKASLNASLDLFSNLYSVVFRFF